MLIQQTQSSAATGGAVPPTVNVSNRVIFNVQAFDPCFAGVRIDSDGVLQVITESFGLTSISNEWMVGGADPPTDTAGFFVESNVNSGSLDNDDMTTRIICDTGDLDIWILQTSAGSSTCNVTLDFYDAVSGGTLLDSGTFNLRAETGSL